LAHPYDRLSSRAGPILVCYLAQSLSGSWGIRTSGLNDLHILALAAAFLVSSLEPPLFPIRMRRLLGLALAALTLLLVTAWDAPERLALLPFFVAAVGLAAPAAGRKERALPFTILSLATLCYFLVFLLQRHPLVSRAVGGIGSIAAGEVRLGPTYLGLATGLFFFIFFSVALLFTRGSGREVALSLGGAGLIQISAFWLTMPLIQPLLYGTVFGLAVGRRTLKAPSPPGSSRPGVGFLALLLAVLLGLALAIGGSFVTRAGPPRPGRVLVFPDGCLRWEDHERASRGESEKEGPVCGAYGLLRRHLEPLGYSFQLSGSPVTASDLSSARILLLVEPLRALSAGEREAIWAFVRAGGSLLAVGDHTDADGSSTRLNEVLEPAGIQLNFDTVYPFPPRKDWEGALSSWPIGFARAADARGTGVRHGASLTLRGSALPILVGTHSLLDRGDSRNRAQGNLGNGELDPGEQIGDAVLAALAFPGRGKLLVFGDSTSFQNDMLARTHGFVAGVFDYLSAPGGAPGLVRYPVLPIMIAALALLTPIAVSLRPSLCWAALCAAVTWVVTFIAAPGPPDGRQEYPVSNVAAIDVTHGVTADPLGPGPYGMYCLLDALAGEGFLPILEDRQAGRGAGRRIHLLAAPELPLSGAEIASLRDFVEHGGLLVVTAGGDCGFGARGLLREFHYRIEKRPLGSAPGAEATWTQDPVRFSSAWSVVSTSGRDEILCTSWQYPLIRFRPVGRGGVLVIGDCEHFLDKNLRKKKPPSRCREGNESVRLLVQLLADRARVEGSE
jgi:hypothetical protein